jgi:hypothetical protein
MLMVAAALDPVRFELSVWLACTVYVPSATWAN